MILINENYILKALMILVLVRESQLLSGRK